jgi:phenylacetate-CoA ligase
MTEKLYTAAVALLEKIIWTIDVGPSVHKFFLAPELGNFRVSLGKVKAVRLYRYASRRVPAYADFLSKHPHKGPLVAMRSVSLRDVPEMDKASYIKQYSLLEKVVDGVLPTAGVMFDESSGSSGKPTSWVRGKRERRMTRRIMQVSFQHLIGEGKPIILNTFSMGAWATGFNTSTCLLEVGRVKSIGPDKTKVIDTLLELGPGFDYVILGYPPFLRLLTESTEIDWSQYKISAIYGGEGLSEAMRTYLLQYYQRVIGSYGASDLEINIAHESDFTIALRKALIDDAELRSKILKINRGIVPMVFQYNPYDYLFETNEKGELLVTICRLYNLSPRIRYNIHDLGHATDFYDLKQTLVGAGRQDLVDLAELDFGVLFHYGRSDLSVDYNGAVVGPEEVRQIIENSDFRDKVNTFRLVSYEDESARKHLLIAVEASPDETLHVHEKEALLARIVTSLQETNLDFKSAHSTAQLKPELKVYEFGKGIFDSEHTKLKNDYIWNIDSARAKREGIL